MCRKHKNGKKGFFGEFKEFISKGSVVDLAVGVIIGGAFTAIVTALTTHIFQPLINWLISVISGGNNALESARTILGKTVYQVAEDGSVLVDANGAKLVDWANTLYIDWGAFISAIINFLLVALILFCIVKAINSAKAAKEKIAATELEKYYEKHPEERPAPAPEAVPVPSEADLLIQIRDILKEKK